MSAIPYIDSNASDEMVLGALRDHVPMHIHDRLARMVNCKRDTGRLLEAYCDTNEARIPAKLRAELAKLFDNYGDWT